MRHFILDTNIIIQNPAILAKGNEQVRFVIPESVILELASFEHSRESSGQILDLVQNALQHGAYQLSVPPSEVFKSPQLERIPPYRLSAADLAIAKSVDYYQRQLYPKDKFPETIDDTFFVTDDKPLAHYIEFLGVKTIGSRELEAKLRNSTITNQDINRKASFITLLQRRELIIGIVVGILVSLVANLIVANLYTILTSINVWGTIALIPLAGIALFWFRSKNRLAYGIAEVLFGLFTGLRVFIPNFNYSQLDTTGFVQIAGGLYIMVRGMDNIGKRLIGTRFETTWKRFFGES